MLHQVLSSVKEEQEKRKEQEKYIAGFCEKYKLPNPLQSTVVDSEAKALQQSSSDRKDRIISLVHSLLAHDSYSVDVLRNIFTFATNIISARSKTDTQKTKALELADDIIKTLGPEVIAEPKNIKLILTMIEQASNTQKIDTISHYFWRKPFDKQYKFNLMFKYALNLDWSPIKTSSGYTNDRFDKFCDDLLYMHQKGLLTEGIVQFIEKKPNALYLHKMLDGIIAVLDEDDLNIERLQNIYLPFLSSAIDSNASFDVNCKQILYRARVLYILKKLQDSKTPPSLEYFNLVIASRALSDSLINLRGLNDNILLHEIILQWLRQDIKHAEFFADMHEVLEWVINIEKSKYLDLANISEESRQYLLKTPDEIKSLIAGIQTLLLKQHVVSSHITDVFIGMMMADVAHVKYFAEAFNILDKAKLLSSIDDINNFNKYPIEDLCKTLRVMQDSGKLDKDNFKAMFNDTSIDESIRRLKIQVISKLDDITERACLLKVMTVISRISFNDHYCRELISAATDQIQILAKAGITVDAYIDLLSAEIADQTDVSRINKIIGRIKKVNVALKILSEKNILSVETFSTIRRLSNIDPAIVAEFCVRICEKVPQSSRFATVYDCWMSMTQTLSELSMSERMSVIQSVYQSLKNQTTTSVLPTSVTTPTTNAPSFSTSLTQVNIATSSSSSSSSTSSSNNVIESSVKSSVASAVAAEQTLAFQLLIFYQERECIKASGINVGLAFDALFRLRTGCEQDLLNSKKREAHDAVCKFADNSADIVDFLFMVRDKATSTTATADRIKDFWQRIFNLMPGADKTKVAALIHSVDNGPEAEKSMAKLLLLNTEIRDQAYQETQNTLDTQKTRTTATTQQQTQAVAQFGALSSSTITGHSQQDQHHPTTSQPTSNH